MEVLTLNPSNGLSYYLAIIIIFLVSQIRVLLYKSNRPWTNKIGGKWIWISAAAIISVAVCVVLKINIIQDVFGLVSVGSVELDGYVGYVASGVAISLSSNISAWAAQRPYKTAQKEDKPTPEPVPIEPVDIPVATIPAPEPIKEEEPKIYKAKILVEYPIDVEGKALVLIERSDGKRQLVKLDQGDNDDN